MKFRDLINDTNIITVNEAQFSEAKLSKVVELYSKVLGRDFGGTFKNLGIEDYTRKSGPGKGIRTMNDKGVQLRFNWDAKKAKDTEYVLTSIDYWKEDNTNFEKPTRTVTFGPDLNVLQVLSVVATGLKTGTINEAQDEIEYANIVIEAKNRTREEKQAWLASKGLPLSLAGSEKALIKRAEREGYGEEIRVFLGETEKNTFESGLKEAEKALSSQVYADPETVFSDIEDLLSVVAAKKWRTLVVCGQGGIGKTFHITEGSRSLKALLGPVGKKWEYHSGSKASPLSFYKTLFQERDKIIVFDEADSLLKNDEIIMMLKPILDTSGDNMAAYMTGTENMVGRSNKEVEEYCNYVDEMIEQGSQIGTGKNDVRLPSKFPFTGGMIFISNMRANQIEQAIMSRSIFIDVYLAEKDVLKRIRSIGYAQAKSAKSGITKADVDDVLEALGQSSIGKDEEVTYMTPEYARKHKQVTVRAMQLALTLKKAGLTRWKELAALYA